MTNLITLDDLSLINQGRLLARFNQAVLKAQEQYTAHVKKWGSDAKGAKATITMKLTMVCTSGESGETEIRAKVTLVPPDDPEMTSVATVDKERPEALLFVRPDGSSEDPPCQMVMATYDGRTVDTQTGEIVDDEESGASDAYVVPFEQGVGTGLANS